MYRQGDVLLVPIDAVPRPARRNDGPVRLSRGRTSRYPHAVSGKRVEAFMANGHDYLRVHETATMTHPEHAPLAIPAGIYRVLRQREYPDDRRPPTFSIAISE